MDEDVVVDDGNDNDDCFVAVQNVFIVRMEVLDLHFIMTFNHSKSYLAEIPSDYWKCLMTEVR
ncbi:hypothetical protein BLOT_002386 [Blomia tropicalis]|nr:hypothetical protein BLOT_002386 [Blomia tropicalis]